MIDDTDIKILSILRDDARISAAEVARQVGMAPSAVFERIRKLEDRGVVRGYAAMLNPRAVGYGVLAFVAVSAREGSGAAAVGVELAKVPGVQEVHHIAGSDDYLVKIRAVDAEGLGRVLQERFKAIPGLRSTRTTVVLNTIKETPGLAVPGERAAEKAERVAEKAPAAGHAGAGHAGAGHAGAGHAGTGHALGTHGPGGHGPPAAANGQAVIKAKASKRDAAPR